MSQSASVRLVSPSLYAAPHSGIPFRRRLWDFIRSMPDDFQMSAPRDDATRLPTRRRPRCRRREAARCGVCGLHRPLCVCATLPCFDLPFRLILVQHGVEVDRPTNTGRLALRMLSNHALVLYGRRGIPLDTSPLEDPALDYRLLFPRDGAPWLAPEDLRPRADERNRRPALVVADGTWAQASHMTRRIGPLRNMRCVRLPPGPPGLWRIRRPRRPEQLCTLEAVIRAMAVAGFAAESAALLDALREVHRRLLAMRAGFPAGGGPLE